MDLFVVELVNWDKYAGEGKRYESTTWFRMQNDLGDHLLWDILSDAEFRVFTFLLSHVSKNAHRTGKLVVSITGLARLTGKSKAIVRSTLEKLASPQLKIILLTEYSPCDPRAEPVQTQFDLGVHPVLRNETLRNEDPPNPPSGGGGGAPPAGNGEGPAPLWSPCEGEIREVIEAYPGRGRDDTAREKLLNLAPDEETWQRFRSAVDSYAEEMRTLRKPPDKIRHLSNFIEGGFWLNYVRVRSKADVVRLMDTETDPRWRDYVRSHNQPAAMDTG